MYLRTKETENEVLETIITNGHPPLLHCPNRIRIAFGDREVLNKVTDLPDTDEYKTGEGNYIDLATHHTEFSIAYVLPLYIEKEPRLVGYCEKEETYYELTEEQLSAILTANNLDGRKLNHLEKATLTEYPLEGQVKAQARGNNVKAYKLSLPTNKKPIDQIIYSCLIFTNIPEIPTDPQETIQDIVVANDFLKQLGEKYPNLKVALPIFS